MHTLLNAPDQPAIGQFEERKSVFIGAACRINDQSQALAFLETRRLADPKARHVCHCAIWKSPDSSSSNQGTGNLNEHMSDDGEPSGTAGKSILEVLRRNEITNCIVTVTRYFGGILLGSGGLIRAYSTAASLALQAADLAQIVPAQCLAIQVDYSQYQRLQRLIASVHGQVSGETFTDRVSVQVNISTEQVPAFISSLTNLFNGQVQASNIGSAILLDPC
ncbi:IMPACT family protein [Bombiscardovia coagulans]|uniref:IMPACT family member YigZ n=1 Tax=Bombiscardovia coagulans TaxID=686666 RepID=A0A261EU03_9BIFI|nr:YigZ family protein [Bombiscardovia coagulans]OZG50338.1 IMPACT family member YigZ [Bombiscardovia coagulans]